MDTDSAFSSIDLVGQCLLDKKRTQKFIDQISKEVKSGMTVLDAGTGSGILAILSAKYGASKVYAVELDPYIAAVAKKNIVANNVDNIVEVIQADMRDLNLYIDRKIDLVTMEMLTTGMIDEYQVRGVSELKKLRSLDESTIFLPKKQKSFLSLGYSDFKLYNLNFPMVLHLWDIHINKEDFFKQKTERIKYDDYDFKKDTHFYVDKNIDIKIDQDCRVNCILMESQTVLNEENIIEETSALNGKVIVPIESKDLVAGEMVHCNISYKYGDGFRSLLFKWL